MENGFVNIPAGFLDIFNAVAILQIPKKWREVANAGFRKLAAMARFRNPAFCRFPNVDHFNSFILCPAKCRRYVRQNQKCWISPR